MLLFQGAIWQARMAWGRATPPASRIQAGALRGIIINRIPILTPFHHLESLSLSLSLSPSLSLSLSLSLLLFFFFSLSLSLSVCLSRFSYPSYVPTGHHSRGRRGTNPPSLPLLLTCRYQPSSHHTHGHSIPGDIRDSHTYVIVYQPLGSEYTRAKWLNRAWFPRYRDSLTYQVLHSDIHRRNGMYGNSMILRYAILSGFNRVSTSQKSNDNLFTTVMREQTFFYLWKISVTEREFWGFWGSFIRVWHVLGKYLKNFWNWLSFYWSAGNIYVKQNKLERENLILYFELYCISNCSAESINLLKKNLFDLLDIFLC